MTRFELGRLLISRGVMDEMSSDPKFSDFVFDCFERHASNDWGTLPEEDIEANEEALKNDNRLLSAYIYKDGVKIWIITEADRSATTALFPDEY